MATVPERVQADATEAWDERDLLRRALEPLPVRQRATVVLRFYDDYTEATTAVILGCSVGTVKSQTAKALAKLADALGAPPAGLVAVVPKAVVPKGVTS